MRFSLVYACALAIVLAGAYSSSASANPSVTAVVSGESYTITTVQGTETMLSASLSAQPWFGNIVLAGEIADAVGSQLGLPNTVAGIVTVTSPAGPAFSDSFDERYQGVNFLLYDPRLGGAVFGSASNTAPVTFAELVPSTSGTAVPEPSSVEALCAGLSALALTRRQCRRQSVK